MARGAKGKHIVAESTGLGRWCAPRPTPLSDIYLPRGLGLALHGAFSLVLAKHSNFITVDAISMGIDGGCPAAG